MGGETEKYRDKEKNPIAGNWKRIAQMFPMCHNFQTRRVFLLFATRKHVWSLIFDKSAVPSEMMKLKINAKPKTKFKKNDIETFYCLWSSSVRPFFLFKDRKSEQASTTCSMTLCFSRWRQSLRVCLWGCWCVRASPLSLLHAPPHQAGKDGHHHFGLDFYQVLC